MTRIDGASIPLPPSPPLVPLSTGVISSPALTPPVTPDFDKLTAHAGVITVPAGLRPLSSSSLTKELDDRTRLIADGLMVIDDYMDRQEALPEEGDVLMDRLRKAAHWIRERDEASLRHTVDPNGELPWDRFSYVSVTAHPAGAICVELGNAEDLKIFRARWERGSITHILQEMGLGDSRGEDTFAAQYFRRELFGPGDHLGVIVVIRDQQPDETRRNKTIRHELSHAILAEVVRPLHHRRFFAIDLNTNAVDRKAVILALGDEGIELARRLDLLPAPECPPHLLHLFIGARFRDEIFLLDELRAHTYDHFSHPPKTQITDVELAEAEPAMVKNYFEVYLLHLRARLMSDEARKRSLAILGASLSLSQAVRFLDAELKDWRFDQNDDQFANRLLALRLILDSEKHMDFSLGERGAVIDQQHVRRVLIPDRELIDEEIVRRWGTIQTAPKKVRESYEKIYSV